MFLPKCRDGMRGSEGCQKLLSEQENEHPGPRGEARSPCLGQRGSGRGAGRRRCCLLGTSASG